jgi:hypothetical protein
VAGRQVVIGGLAGPSTTEADEVRASARNRRPRKNLLAAVVSRASDVAWPPRAVANLALLLMLFRRGLDVTMMIRSWLPPCEGWG